jgi:hypothetical protein
MFFMDLVYSVIGHLFYLSLLLLHYLLVLLLLPLVVNSGIHFFISIFNRDIAVWGDNYYVMIDEKITGPFIAGACLFGFGWGLSGL